jgi:hypothetical protein
MGNKFVALVGSGRQTCRPSRDEKGLKDWANVLIFCSAFQLLITLCHSAAGEEKKNISAQLQQQSRSVLNT